MGCAVEKLGCTSSTSLRKSRPARSALQQQLLVIGHSVMPYADDNKPA